MMDYHVTHSFLWKRFISVDWIWQSWLASAYGEQAPFGIHRSYSTNNVTVVHLHMFSFLTQFRSKWNKSTAQGHTVPNTPKAHNASTIVEHPDAFDICFSIFRACLLRLFYTDLFVKGVIITLYITFYDF